MLRIRLRLGPARARVAAFALASFACLLGGLRVFTACSLLVDQSAAQCSVDADCLLFPGTRCAQGACVTVSVSFDANVDPSAPCTSTQDCFTLHGSNWVCKSSRCQPLGSDDCGIVIGNYAADNVLLFGAILPIYGPHKSTGLPMERALALAAEQDFAGGVAFGPDGGTRPVAVVLCDESQNAVRAATHLVNDVGVPAILGPAFGDSYLAVAEQVTIPKHVLLISPYATADLSSLSVDAGGDGLAWRTAPSSAGEAAAMAAVVSTVLEPKIRGAGGARIAVGVLWRSDADGTSLHDALLQSLAFNGLPATAPANAAAFDDVSYGNSDTPGNQGTAAVTKLTSAPVPQLVIVLGRTEAVSLIAGIEHVWPTTTPRPYYLVSHGLQVEELLALAAAVPGRVLSLTPGDSASTNAALRALLVRYEALYTDYPAQTFGIPQAFDGYYALAYGLAGVRNTDVVGLDERDGLERVLFTPGPPVAVTLGPGGMSAAFAAIAAGKPIALEGTSGALEFDPATGTPPSNVALWCMTATGTPAFTSSGVVWSADAGALEGTLAAGCLE